MYFYNGNSMNQWKINGNSSNPPVLSPAGFMTARIPGADAKTVQTEAICSRPGRGKLGKPATVSYPLGMVYIIIAYPSYIHKQDGSHEPECIHVLGLRVQTSAKGKRTFFCMHRALISSQRRHLSNSSQRDS